MRENNVICAQTPKPSRVGVSFLRITPNAMSKLNIQRVAIKDKRLFSSHMTQDPARCTL